MSKSHIRSQSLKLALQVLLTYQTILGMVRKEKVNHCSSRLDSLLGICLYNHSIKYWCCTCRSQGFSSLNFNNTHPAACSLVDHLYIVKVQVTQGRYLHIYQLGSLQNRSPLRNLYHFSVYVYIHHTHHPYPFEMALTGHAS